MDEQRTYVIECAKKAGFIISDNTLYRYPSCYMQNQDNDEVTIQIFYELVSTIVNIYDTDIIDRTFLIYSKLRQNFNLIDVYGKLQNIYDRKYNTKIYINIIRYDCNIFVQCRIEIWFKCIVLDYENYTINIDEHSSIEDNYTKVYIHILDCYSMLKLSPHISIKIKFTNQVRSYSNQQAEIIEIQNEGNIILFNLTKYPHVINSINYINNWCYKYIPLIYEYLGNAFEFTLGTDDEITFKTRTCIKIGFAFDSMDNKVVIYKNIGTWKDQILCNSLDCFRESLIILINYIKYRYNIDISDIFAKSPIRCTGSFTKPAIRK